MKQASEKYSENRPVWHDRGITGDHPGDHRATRGANSLCATKPVEGGRGGDHARSARATTVGATMDAMTQADAQPDPRAAATKVVSVLREAGHTAYFAGGCVRDMLRGAEPKDYDVATDAPPDAVGQLFKNTRAVGEAFGVVLVRLRRCEIEVATFRTEWGYTDGRRPDHVEFADAEHDARRRDFTINGIFYDPLDGTVIDHVGGRADIEAKRIRAIGDPDERFGEDYLRMVRAVRFAARLGYTIDGPTEAAILRHAPKLSRIARERIGMEVEAMLAAPGRGGAVKLLGRLELDGPVLNEDAGTQANAVVDLLGPGASYATALAAWAIDRHLPGGATPADRLDRLKRVQIARRWREALVLSNDDHAAMCNLLAALATAQRWPKLTVAQKKRLLGRGDVQQLCDLFRAFSACHGAEAHDAMIDQTADLAGDGVGIAPPPLITGDDLVEAGHKPGPGFKRALDAAYDAQLEGRAADRDEALAIAARALG